MTQPKFTNRLIHETSPYLRQHAHNPVDWYPWGDEALLRAKELDRPIFLSIGYSACHWCHVMEHESFEDPETGTILNDHFVSIKVDREERPDLDQIYMMAVQLLTRQGGWPMSMFLLTDRRPFYGGTYFPPADRYGRPSFKRVLLTLVDYWKNRRQDLEQNAANLTASVQANLQLDASEGSLSADLLTNAGQVLGRAFDPRHGGFGQAPKFPHPMEIRLLLRLHRRFGDDAALSMANLTLDQMAMGGMYDQLGGGFHRYSTDAEWLVPHFEKMLYDNALLALAYLEAWQVTRNPFYREVVEETLHYVLREMTSPHGGFYSTQDADSEGEEGKFFVWKLAEVQDMLGPEEAKIFASVYDITPQGNWEGRNILRRLRPYGEDAKQLGLDEPQLRVQLDACKRTLLAVRRERIWPARDEKILTAWNGLMIATFAKAAQALDNPAYAHAAGRAADFLLRTLRRPDGRLYRTTFAGSAPKLNGFLDDYAYVIDALVSLYETTFEPRWLNEAISLATVMIEQFADETDGGFFYTGKDHESLITRSKDQHDNATPSGNSMAATGLLRLAKLTGRADLHQHAVRTLECFRSVMAQAPTAAGQMLLALDFHLGPVQEIAIVGEAHNVELQQCLQLLRTTFRPNQVVAWKPPSETPEELATLLPWLANRSAEGVATVYVCQDSVCQAPLVGARSLQGFLETQ